MCTCSFLWNREYFIVTIPSPEKYPRLSEAIAGGLYHPNCKDIHTTYFEGVTTPPKPMTDAEKKEASRVYNLEQQQRYNERQIRKYKRLADGSVDPENQQRYQQKLEEWQGEQKRFVKANGDVLKRRYENEKLLTSEFSTPPKISDSIRQPRQTKDLTNIPKRDIMTKETEKASVVHSSSGSDLLSKEAKTKLQRSERILSGNRYETAEIYDTDGNLVFSKKGSQDEISFTNAEIKKMKNCIVTHNHPSGSGFSADDIGMLRRSGASEFRASTRGGTFVIRQPERWPESLQTIKDIDVELDRIYDEVGNKYRDIAAQQGSHIIRYLPDIEKETLHVFGEKHGFYTAFEDVKDMDI